MRQQRNIFQMKEQYKTPEEELSEVETANLPGKGKRHPDFQTGSTQRGALKDTLPLKWEKLKIENIKRSKGKAISYI